MKFLKELLQKFHKVDGGFKTRSLWRCNEKHSNIHYDGKDHDTKHGETSKTYFSQSKAQGKQNTRRYVNKKQVAICHAAWRWPSYHSRSSSISASFSPSPSPLSLFRLFYLILPSLLVFDLCSSDHSSSHCSSSFSLSVDFSSLPFLLVFDNL